MWPWILWGAFACTGTEETPGEAGEPTDTDTDRTDVETDTDTDTDSDTDTDTDSDDPYTGAIDPLASSDVTLRGEPQDYLHGSIVDDVTGDGRDDLVLGAQRPSDDLRGALYVVSAVEPGEWMASDVATARIAGSDPHELFAEDAFAVGDVTGDGGSDLAVTDFDGRVTLFEGPLVGELTSADAAASFRPSSSFPQPDVLSGDLDHDGRADLLVASGSDASVHVVLGPVTGDHDRETATFRLAGEGDASTFGVAALTADLDGDGASDLVIGDAQGAGAAYVFHGPLATTRPIADADVVVTGLPDPVLPTGFGSVLSSGDLDGEGRPDLIVGAPFDGGEVMAGAAYVFEGPLTSGTCDAATATLTGDPTTSFVGTGLSTGDLDGDAHDDLLIASNYDTYLFYGPVSSEVQDVSSADARFADGESQGGLTSDVGDVDGDGRADLLLGDEGADDLGSWQGAVYVLFGP